VALLEVEDVAKSFRGLRAIERVSFDLERHSITALIGPNGAGKTTLFNLIAGAFRPDRGHIRLNGRAIGGLPTSRSGRLRIHCARGSLSGAEIGAGR